LEAYPGRESHKRHIETKRKGNVLSLKKKKKKKNWGYALKRMVSRTLLRKEEKDLLRISGRFF